MPRRGIARAAALPLLFLLSAGCSVPSWMPLVGRPKAQPNVPPVIARDEVQKAPLLPGPPAERPKATDSVVDRVVCIVNNDAITQYEIEEAEAYHYYETKQPPAQGEEQKALRDQILQRLIENRLQLQQAEREKVTVEDAEISEQLGEILKKLSVKTEAELGEALKPQGLTMEVVKRRIRETVMVQKLLRRKVTLRVSVTEQEIDRYLQDNRDKLETGLTFEARHILFLPPPDAGEDAWEVVRRRAEQAHGRLVAGENFAELAKTVSDDASGKDGGSLGPLKRGELAPEIEAEILKLRPGEVSGPVRTQVGYHLFRLESRESLTGEALAQARNQIRDILFREKYQVRFKEWLAEIKQRAMIEMRL